VTMSKVSEEIQYKSDVDVELVDFMGSDLSIARSAWVSTKPKLDIDPPPERVKGLINFLMRDRHGTPFEHNSLTFQISAPLFVFYEFHRHRVGWSYNEESARYRELEPVFYMPRDDRALRQIGKPGAYVFEPGNYSERKIAYGAHRRVAVNAWGEYKALLEAGIAREVARNILPVSIYKTMYATCNLRSLFSFLSLRWAHPLSQVPTFPLDEIQMVAQSLDELAREKFPLAFETFDANGRIGP
jgi:thymidylate synthase (FAD)